jgi:hypothetical protein
MLPRNSEQSSDFSLGFTGGREDILAEQLTWMRGAAVGVAGHTRLLVILFVVQYMSVAIAELESDAPRTVYMDRVADRIVTS